mgnify:CR=1 FL=1
MKYLKLTLPKGSGGNLTYPANYQSEIGDKSKDHLYFEENGVTKLLLLFNDADFSSNMVKENVEEVTEVDAKKLSETYEVRSEVVASEAMARRLELKSRLGLTLTTEEMDAIDPTKPGGAFETSKILADRIEEKKSIEAATISPSI